MSKSIHTYFSLILVIIVFTCTVPFKKNDSILSTDDQRDSVRLIHHAIDTSAGGVECYKIVTPTATYFLEKSGAGLSSLIDLDGNDWISFHPDPGSGAAGEYRGFPNAVHQQDGNYFHPMNEDTDSSEIEILFESKERITLQVTSHSNTWQARWDFYQTHCCFTMTKMPDGFKYWVLYEGTPGGEYEDSDWWMTSAIPEKQPLPRNHEKDIPEPEWIAFGDQDFDRSLFLYHHEDDNEIDRYYQMEKKMTVFGFGRSGLTKFLETVPQSFSIGMLESTEYKEIAMMINQLAH